jgi:hypothetical protein
MVPLLREQVGQTEDNRISRNTTSALRLGNGCQTTFYFGVTVARAHTHTHTARLLIIKAEWTLGHTQTTVAQTIPAPLGAIVTTESWSVTIKCNSIHGAQIKFPENSRSYENWYTTKTTDVSWGHLTSIWNFRSMWKKRFYCTDVCLLWYCKWFL